MISHYLSTAFRHFRQHKLTTGINALCLTLGLLCFIVSWGTVAYFEQRDRYHEHAARTYLMTWKEAQRPGAREQLTTPFLLAPQLHADFPELEHVARMLGPQGINVRHEGRGYYSLVAFADPAFLRVFDLPVLGADRRTALDQP